jgi:hypothetical protein
LFGTVWGWFNYDPDSDRDNTQFDVQFGDALCRCPFWLRDLNRSNFDMWPTELEPFGREYTLFAENYILSCALNGSLEFNQKRFEVTEERKSYSFVLSERPFFGKHSVDFGSGDNLAKRVQYRLSEIFRPETERRLYPRGESPVTEPHTQAEINETIRKCTEDLRKMLQKRTPNSEKPPEWWSAELDTIAAGAELFATRWNALMARLRTVEQLYIGA